MKTYLVTGAAGFIGANYIKYILAKHSDVKVVILDALTYAGNLGTIAKDIDNERCFFIKGDICSREVVDGLFAEYRFDYVVNFAAESHVDRSIENPQLFLITNILGTQNLLDCARRAWVMGKDEQGYPTWRKGVRYHQVSTDEVYGSLGAEGFFTEATPLCPHSPYSASKTSADMVVMAYHDTYKMPVTITRCSNNYGPYHFPEKLIPLIIKDLISFVKDRLGHDQRYAIDPTKITNALGWYPETKFEVGIVKTIEWYLNNQPWVEEVTSGDYQGYYEKMYGK